MSEENAKKETVKQLQFWMFTWNASNLTNTQGMPDRQLLCKFLNERGWLWVFQHEIGDKNGRHHYQGRLNVMKRMCKGPILGMFEGGGFDITNLTVLPESNNSLKVEGGAFYCTKPNRVEGPWADPSWLPPRIIPEYEGEDVQCVSDNPTPMQKLFIQTVTETVADDRYLIWMCNFSGNSGKTKAQKLLDFKNLGYGIPMGTATQIKTAVCLAKAYKIYFCNIPKVSGSQESQKDLFSAIESIKDGYVRSAMYGKDHRLFMKCPHVWIFSNELPDFNHASPDRWKVYMLDDLWTEPKLLTIHEVNKIREERKGNTFDANINQETSKKLIKKKVKNDHMKDYNDIKILSNKFLYHDLLKDTGEFTHQFHI